MLAQHALMINTSPVSGLSSSQQKGEGDQQALFAQILKNDLIAADSSELTESPATLNHSADELSDEALKQLVADLKQLFAPTERAVSEEAAVSSAEPSLADQSSEETAEKRQSVMPGGNELPPSPEPLPAPLPESLLNTLNNLSPEQFDEVMAQLPEVAISLKRELTADGHPIVSNVILKNITVINGRLVSGDGSPINTKTEHTLAISEQGGEASVDNKRELALNLQLNGHSTALSATQYRAQMLQNASNGNGAQVGESVHVDDERSSLMQLDTGLGSKSQQHDRLMSTLFNMRQELAAERQPVDVRQRTLLSEQLNSATALSDLDGDALNGLVSLSTPSTGSQAVTTAVNLPLQHPRWGTAVSEKVVWMMNAQIKEAAIKLNPASLGSIEIKLSLIDDQANVTFNVLTSQAKEALESALPRLREMLAEQGIALNDTSVSDQSEHQDDKSQSLLADLPHQQDDSSAHHDDAGLQSVMTVNTQTGVDIYI